MYKTLLLLSAIFLLSSNGNFYSSLSEKECQTLHNDKVKVTEVNDLGRRYGYAIWLNTSAINAKYHVEKSNSQNVYQRYTAWKNGKSIVLTSSGGYSTDGYQKPLGLTIEAGKVVNNFLNHEMEAVVLIYNGTIEVINTKKKMRIKAMNQTLQLSKSSDKIAFVNKVKQLKGTVFQTHLLAMNNELKIKANSNRKIAERKLLVNVKKGKETFYVLFYIKKGERLYDASKKVHNYLKDKKYTVNSIINLDTGVHNILKTYQIKSCTNQVIQGESNINSAVNLISFYK